jgi:hypothetical protein
MPRAQPSATTIYDLQIVNPMLQSLHCREHKHTVTATADACARQSFIAMNGDGIADLLDLGDHAGRVELQVYDVAGRLVQQFEDYHNDWDAGDMHRGLYVYRVLVGGDCPSTFVGKIVVVR